MTDTLIAIISIFLGMIGANIFAAIKKKYSLGFIGNTITGIYGSIFFIKIEIKQKKILISDYDNTFHVYYDSLLENKVEFKYKNNFYDENNIIDRVNKFRINNLFCINTGRSYDSLKRVSPDLSYDKRQ